MEAPKKKSKLLLEQRDSCILLSDVVVVSWHKAISSFWNTKGVLKKPKALLEQGNVCWVLDLRKKIKYAATGRWINMHSVVNIGGGAIVVRKNFESLLEQTTIAFWFFFCNGQIILKHIGCWTIYVKVVCLNKAIILVEAPELFKTVLKNC